MKLGIIGLGNMGRNMAERLRQHGHEVVGYDRDPEATEVPSLDALVASLDAPRAVWSMVPHGDPTEETIAKLGELLQQGDIVVDGANSDYRDSMRRSRMLAERGIRFLDAGVSGGVWGRTEGYCLMVGGDAADIALLQPALEALAPAGGSVHAGPVGAGHFAKMVHNGVEYGLMQAYGEGYELLRRADLDIDVDAVLRAWRHGAVVRSWLLELLVRALDEEPGLEGIRGYAEDSGMGRWTVREAVRLNVAVPAISAALYARFVSRQEDSLAMRVIAALRNQFGGHPIRSAE